jgi:peroxiredoxin
VRRAEREACSEPNSSKSAKNGTPPALRVVLGALAVASAIALAGCEKGEAASPTTTTGGRASDFTTRDIDGKTVHLTDYLGKQAVLLDFCATWCQPCLAELSHLRRIYAKEKPRGFVVLAIAMDSSDTVAEVPAWARRNSLDFPVLLDEDSHIAGVYNPKKSAPLTVLIDKKGDIVYVHDGYNPGDEVSLEEHVAKVLEAPAAPASSPAGPK